MLRFILDKLFDLFSYIFKRRNIRNDIIETIKEDIEINLQHCKDLLLAIEKIPKDFGSQIGWVQPMSRFKTKTIDTLDSLNRREFRKFDYKDEIIDFFEKIKSLQNYIDHVHDIVKKQTPSKTRMQEYNNELIKGLKDINTQGENILEKSKQ